MKSQRKRAISQDNHYAEITATTVGSLQLENVWDFLEDRGSFWILTFNTESWLDANSKFKQKQCMQRP